MESEPLVPTVPPARPMRPQYHFFYGSTTESSGNDDGRSTSVASQHQSEQESLIGESLVPTDNEEEPPTASASDYDLQHVLISNGGSRGGMRHVVGVQPPNNNNRNGNGNGSHPLGGTNNTNNGKNGGTAMMMMMMNGTHNNNGSHPLGGVKSFRQSFGIWRENHPVVHIVGLVGCMTICMAVFAITLFPSTTQSAAKDAMGAAASTSSSASIEPIRKFVMKFPTVDRSKSNDPIKAFLHKELFHPDLLHKGTTDPLREFSFAFPTGAFWVNLVLPPTADRGFSFPIAVYPYAYKWSGFLLSISYPALHRKEEPKAIHDYFFPDLTFGSVEDVQTRQITGFDPLSVSLQFLTNNGSGAKNGDGSWKTYLVQGSPYVTIEYDNVTPRIMALSTFKNVVCPGEDGMNYDKTSGQDYDDFDDNFSDDDSVSGKSDSGSSRRKMRRKRRLLGVCGTSTDNGGLTTLHGVQFVLQSQEGVNWIVFSSEPISFVFDTVKKTDVVSSKVYKGTIRLAIIPPSSKLTDSGNGMVQISSSTGLRRLVYHASVYPIGAKVDYSFRDPTASTTTSNNIAKSVLSGLTGAGGVLTSNRKTAEPTASASGRVADVHFQFVTKTANGNDSAAVATGKTTGLLMLSLPHHVFSFTNSHVLDSKHFDLVYQCIKGSMTPVVGSVWTYEEKLPKLGFEPLAGDPSMSSSSSSLETIFADKTVRKLLTDNLQDDLRYAMPTRTENIYGFGKQAARLAQLAHIADKVAGPNSAPSGESPSNTTSSNKKSGTFLGDPLVKIRQIAMEQLSGYLDLLLTNQLSDSLLYDASLGGLVSTDGLDNFNADFGNGRYNDHHFHYGYILYACAVMGKLNATFVEEHGDKVDAIMHDVAYNSNIKDGSFFPLARHMSWFDGHSFASGLFPFGNGKSQESSSEAVNCYYGAYLWSLVRSGSANAPSSDISVTTDFARLLLAMEIRGAKTYWHMMPPQSSSSSSSSSSGISGGGNITTATLSAAGSARPVVYSANFAQNYMVGNLGMLDAICSTWFGTENLYVHMINFIPVTAITRELFNKEYVVKEYENVISNYPDVEMAWRGYVVCDHALVAPNKAWGEALDLMSAQLDSGLSKSQVLYFILTSPSGFDLSQISSGSNSRGDSSSSGSNKISGDSSSSSSSSSSGTSDSADCSVHSSCAGGGLEGLCCPTKAGTFLDCCNQ